jgi:hypothetical protein
MRHCPAMGDVMPTSAYLVQLPLVLGVAGGDADSAPLCVATSMLSQALWCYGRAHETPHCNALTKVEPNRWACNDCKATHQLPGPLQVHTLCLLSSNSVLNIRAV